MKKAIFFLLLILVVHVAALKCEWYYTFRWFDIPMHIAGGAWIAGAYFHIFVTRKLFNLPRNYLLSLFFALGSVALIGVLWEFHEFLLDILVFKKYGLSNTPGYILFDTLKDLFDDLIGGFVVFSLLFVFSKKEGGVIQKVQA